MKKKTFESDGFEGFFLKENIKLLINARHVNA